MMWAGAGTSLRSAIILALRSLSWASPSLSKSSCIGSRIKAPKCFYHDFSQPLLNLRGFFGCGSLGEGFFLRRTALWSIAGTTSQFSGTIALHGHFPVVVSGA
jgi:hypothetical protein